MRGIGDRMSAAAMAGWAEWWQIVDRHSLTISEMFGPTIQGEGRSAGKPAMFVRLGLCNLDCSWCDTPYTWDWTGKNGTRYTKRHELHREPVAEVVEWLLGHDTRLVVVSGGEPMLQATAVAALATALVTHYRFEVEIETNGTISPSKLGDAAQLIRFNVSPKLSGSGVDPSQAIRLDRLTEFVDLDATFKFVIRTDTDLIEARTICEQVGMPDERVWLMPEGRSVPELDANLPRVIAAATMTGMNVSDRLHVRAFGNKRGV